MQLKDLLKKAVEEKASDVHLKAGMPPMIRKHGTLESASNKFKPLTPDNLVDIARSIMPPAQLEIFEKKRESDFSYGVAGVGRFRVNVAQQRGSIRIVFRTLSTSVPVLDELGLPQVLKRIVTADHGLVLLTGATGSGKSTTLAALVNHLNENENLHVVTIEDPIEFVIPDKKCLITQREVGTDTESFIDALRAALRQDPDVIMIGEMRDIETISVALLAAETGHLVLSTLHTADAAETINRVISSFPDVQQNQVRLQLASVLKGVISQRLVKKTGDAGRVAAAEVMINTPRIRDLIISSAKSKSLIDAIEEGYEGYNMQSFDQSLMQLLTQGTIDKPEALRQSSNPANFDLRMKGITSMGGQKWNAFDHASSGDEGSDVGSSIELEERETAKKPEKPKEEKGLFGNVIKGKK